MESAKQIFPVVMKKLRTIAVGLAQAGNGHKPGLTTASTALSELIGMAEELAAELSSDQGGAAPADPAAAPAPDAPAPSAGPAAAAAPVAADPNPSQQQVPRVVAAMASESHT